MLFALALTFAAPLDGSSRPATPSSMVTEDPAAQKIEVWIEPLGTIVAPAGLFPSKLECCGDQGG